MMGDFPVSSKEYRPVHCSGLRFLVHCSAVSGGNLVQGHVPVGGGLFICANSTGIIHKPFVIFKLKFLVHFERKPLGRLEMDEDTSAVF